jgi:hypothetical protein
MGSFPSWVWHFELVVDVVKAQLSHKGLAVAAATHLPTLLTTCSTVSSPLHGPCSVIMEEFPGVVQQFEVGGQPQHDVEHQIVTTMLLATAKFRRLDSRYSPLGSCQSGFPADVSSWVIEAVQQRLG